MVLQDNKCSTDPVSFLLEFLWVSAGAPRNNCLEILSPFSQITASAMKDVPSLTSEVIVHAIVQASKWVPFILNGCSSRLDAFFISFHKVSASKSDSTVRTTHACTMHCL